MQVTQENYLIHRSAVIDATAKIGEGVKIGPGVVVGPNSVIGDGTEIFPNVVIGPNTILGVGNKIFPFASIGSDPQKLGFQESENTYLVLGDHNVIREYVTINRGTAEGDGHTRLGSHNYIMSCAHIAHDCRVGNHTIFANTASIAGFVEVGDHAILGAFTGIHQFVRVGAYSFMGRATKVYQDVLPYVLVVGNPAEPKGLNVVGLRRNGFSAEQRLQIKQAYSVVYKQGLSKAEISLVLQEMSKEVSVIKPFEEAFTSSKRGVVRPNAQPSLD